MKLAEITVQGYRSLVDVSLPLRSLTTMIGPNGSGKTALLEVLLLLNRAARGDLAKALAEQGGLGAVLSQVSEVLDKLKIDLVIDVESEHSQSPIHYCFELSPSGTGYEIPFERLEWKLNPADKPPWYIDFQYGASMSSRVQRLDFGLELGDTLRAYEELGELRDGLFKIQLYSSLDVGQRAVVRLPQSLTPTTRPGPNGENLYSALYNLRALHKDVHTRIEDVLRIGFPGFERIEFPLVGAGQATMIWYQKDLTNPLYPNQLSEGMLRFLWLTTVLLAPDPPPIILLDEPEVSLHPELIKLLAGLLQDASTRSQVIVATHSPDLVRWLEPQEVLVLDKLDGRTQFTWADTLDLAEWLEEYTLRDLWLMGTLGGRP